MLNLKGSGEDINKGINPYYKDSSSVKQLIHNDLQGYREYEMVRIVFNSDVDMKFYKAMEKNDSDTINKLIEAGHSPNRSYEKETVRIITRDRLSNMNFRNFKELAGEYSKYTQPNEPITIVQEVKEKNSLLSRALSRNSLEVAEVLLKNGGDVSIKNEKNNFLSDYRKKTMFNCLASRMTPYFHIITNTNTKSPILSNLVEEGRLDSVKMLLQYSKDKIDLNEPKEEKITKATYDGFSHWKSGLYTPKLKKVFFENEFVQGITEMLTNSGVQIRNISKSPLEVSVELKKPEMATYLKKSGADIKVLPRKLRKEFRKLEGLVESKTNSQIDKFARGQMKNKSMNNI